MPKMLTSCLPDCMNGAIDPALCGELPRLTGALCMTGIGVCPMSGVLDLRFPWYMFAANIEEN